MKTRCCILIIRLSYLSLLLPAAAPLSVEAQTNSITQPKAPTGFYVTVPEISPKMTLRIATNGNYHVVVWPCGLGECRTQEGTWRWDSEGEDLLLTRSTQELLITENARFDFRRFHINRQEPNTLEWIPRQGTNNVLGVYKTIKFSRQPDGS
jgi:hypothetical protein